MRYERKLVVIGDVIDNTIIDVSVDGSNVKSGLVETGSNVEIYSFTDNVKRHGKLSVDFKIETGSLILKKVRVYYPAIIQSSDEFIIGKFLIDQPIHNPLLKFNQFTKKVEPVNYKLDSSTTFDHIFFNGPSYWVINVKNITSNTFDAGCVHETIPDGGVKINISQHIYPVFLYKNQLFQYDELIEDLYLKGD